MRPGFRSARAACSALAVATLALAACATAPSAPPRPYNSPYAPDGDGYGYSEERVGPELWRVTYHGPWLRLALDRVHRAAELDRAAAVAAELALWRAAQIALAEGKPALAVADRRTDTETVRRPGAYFHDSPWPAYRNGRPPYWYPPAWPPPHYVPGDAAGRAKAVITIRLEARVSAGAMDAAATARRLEATWGGRIPVRP